MGTAEAAVLAKALDRVFGIMGVSMRPAERGERPELERAGKEAGGPAGQSGGAQCESAGEKEAGHER